MLRAGSICFPTSSMFTLALTVLTVCYRLERALSTLGLAENNHTVPSQSQATSEALRIAGRGTGEELWRSVALGGVGREPGEAPVRRPSPSRLVMQLPF